MSPEKFDVDPQTPISKGSAPQIHDVHGYADEHAAAIAPSSGHGTVSDQRTPRALTDARAYDAELQNAIDEATLRLMFSPDREERMRAMDELRTLKLQQRPERVAELEKMRGLR